MQVRHATSLLGTISDWLERLQNTRGWQDGREFIGEDERGNKYFVKKPMTGMVAESSHVKEIRSVEYAGGNHWKECACWQRCTPVCPCVPLTRSPLVSPTAPNMADDPDSVPVEWRQWLNGQQNLPPTITPTSGANATLDRYEDLVIEARPEEATDATTAAQADATGQRHDSGSTIKEG